MATWDVGISVVIGLWAVAGSAVHAAEATAPAERAPSFATSAQIEEFLGEPVFVPPHELWQGRGGWGGVLSTPAGTVVVFRSPGGGELRRSRDGGRTWDEPIVIDPAGDRAAANGGNALVDETTGDLLVVNPQERWLYRSRDAGLTWVRQTIEVLPDGNGRVPGIEGAAAMQCGITLAFGPHKGRLVSPARIMGPENSNDVPWRPYHYSSAIYSDDHGQTWQTSDPFPVMGTGEGAIAELSDGRLLYNSREHMSRGNRFFATSYDGGRLWIEARRSLDLPDGPRGSSYGLMGGMIRLPIAGRDILLASNADTDAGGMPGQVGGSITGGRERVTVWASFDGGQTWPVKRLVSDGPCGYSNLGVGRSGTPSAGRIYLAFEGGLKGSHAAVQIASFNLAWLLDGRPLPAAGAAEPPAVAEPRPLFDDESLGDWKPTPFGGEGAVSVKEGVIRIERGSDMSGITWHGEFPTQEYEISLEARRVDGHDFFCGLTFPVADSHCSLILGGWGGGLVGLSSIDGNDAANNATTQIMSFENGRWYDVRVRVTPDQIECFLDGKQIIEQPLAGHTLSIRSEVAPSLPLGIATYATEAEFRRLSWRPLRPDEPVPPAAR
jgi:sialidase-1